MNSDSPNKNSNIKNANNSEMITVDDFGLISWYATGWLSADERMHVHKLLIRHPELKTYLAEEQHMIQQVKADKSLLDLSALESTEIRLDRVMTQINEATQKNMAQQAQPSSETVPIATALAGSSIKSKFNSFVQSLLSGNTSTMKYASFASLSILVALLVAFMAPMINSDLNQTDTTFQPATVQTAETQKQMATTQLLIGLNEAAQNNWLENIIQKNNAELSKIPGKDGLYRIQFNKKLNANEIESLLNQLNSHKESIWFSGEAY